MLLVRGGRSGASPTLVVAIALFGSAGCMGAHVVECANGRVCPEGTRCDEAGDRCVVPEQAEACDGLGDRDPCTFAGTAGTCQQGLCVPYACGDGVLTPPEQCDGSDVGGKSCDDFGFHEDGPVVCTSACTIDTSSCASICGDGVINGFEACDGDDLADLDCTDFGFYQPAGLACSASCTFVTTGCHARCGDGIKDAEEQCDGDDLGTADCTTLGFYQAGGLKCTPLCTFDPGDCQSSCGDGQINGLEACDGADLAGKDCTSFGYYDADGLSCSNACTFDVTGCQRRCGDGIQDPEEQCDTDDLGGANCTTLGFYQPGGLACSPICTFDAEACVGYCGDGFVDAAHEACDDSPPALTCKDFGFDLGATGCTPQCIPDITGCRLIGWREVTAAGAQATWLYGIHGSDANNVFAVGLSSTLGKRVALHFDGASWTTTVVNDNYAIWDVWTSAPDRAFVAGNAGVYQWDGASWTNVWSGGAVEEVWGTPDGYVFAGGSSGLVRFDGTQWAAVSDYPGTWVKGIWASSASDVWVASRYDGRIYRWNGADWSYTATGLGRIEAFWTDGTSAVAIDGDQAAHYDGTTWTVRTTNSPVSLYGVFGFGPDDVFASGENIIMYWDGSSWTELDQNLAWESGINSFIWDLWGSSPSNIYAAAEFMLASNSGWSWAKMPGADAIWGDAVWGRSSSDMFVRENNRLYHYDGVGWSLDTTAPSLAYTRLTGDATTLYVGEGNGNIASLDSAGWAEIPGPASPLWASPSGTLYGSVGGQVQAWSGAVWVPMGTTAGPTSGVSDSSIIVLQGASTSIYDGSTWTTLPRVSSNYATEIWMAAPGVAYLGSNADTIERLAGGVWSIERQVGIFDFSTVYGTGPDDVFVAGERGRVYHRDAVGWTPIDVGHTDYITGIWVDQRNVFMTDDGGNVRRLIRVGGP